MTNNDERLKKTSDTGRQDRAMEDRAVTESRVLTDDDRAMMWNQTFHQSSLPNLPEEPGYHMCWLTTTSSRDTIHWRQMLGYELIKSSDIPGWDHVSLKTGDYAGYVGVNEMLAAKIPLKLYERFMMSSHHDQPNEAEASITELAETMRRQAEERGSKVFEGEGLREMRDNARLKAKPSFV